MNYLSVCSGIEAATVAWHEMGWNPIAFSEIEKFPSQVLAHHYPNVPNLGDMTKYKEWELSEPIDILVGGTPCQSFSVAGLRKGLEDPRGNLALTYIGILDKFRPKWCVWENVPGVLSSNGGGDFGSFLGALGEIGYGWAYRVLDAQYFGVPQRRRRVFVVGCIGDWKSAARVLFESESLCGDTKKSRSSKKETAGAFIPSTAHCLQTTCNDYSRADGFNMIAYETHPADSRVKEMGDVCQTVTSRWGTGGGNVPLVQAYSLREDAKANNFSATPLQVTPALQAMQPSVQSHHAQTFIAGNIVAPTLTASNNPSRSPQSTEVTNQVAAVYAASMAVRRLTPRECERLQGFKDDYTIIPWKKGESPDGHRYKALGNSMAVPVMKWIGERINEVNKQI